MFFQNISFQFYRFLEFCETFQISNSRNLISLIEKTVFNHELGITYKQTTSIYFQQYLETWQYIDSDNSRKIENLTTLNYIKY